MQFHINKLEIELYEKYNINMAKACEEFEK